MARLKDNPIYRLSRRRIREYRNITVFHGNILKSLLARIPPTPSNQPVLRKWLLKIAGDFSKETNEFLITVVDEVIDYTLSFYNKRHKGKRLKPSERDRLFLKIRKEFLLTEFKGATVDQRLSQADKRLRVNLLTGLETLTQGFANGSQEPETLITYITGMDYQNGGTAYRWNSRLILSEMYRAYQFTGKVVLAELGVERVQWENSPRHEPKGSITDEYAEKVYKPEELPEYPHPCNDSYFIPIY